MTRTGDLDLRRWRPELHERLTALHTALDEAEDRLDFAFHQYGVFADTKHRRRWLWRLEERSRALKAWQAVALHPRSVAPGPARRDTRPRGFAAVIDAPSDGHVRWCFRTGGRI